LASFPRESPNPVWRVDVKTLQLAYSNQPAYKMQQYEPNGYDILLKHLYADIAKTVQYGSPRINECFVFNGWYIFTIAPNTALGYVNIYATDITEQKRTETAYAELNNNLKQIVERRTKELIESNASLQNFAGSVSHDLRAPLRQISGYMSLLKRRLPEADVDAVVYVNEVVNTVRKMDEQIKALLQLSKIDTEPLHPSVFCIREVFDKAIELYKGYYHVKHMDYCFEGNEYAHGDVSLLGVVIDNLVSNAIKYSSEQECVQLRVSGYKQDGMQMFCIEDNGVGFDMKYYEKIFGVFQRLHSNTQFTGMGIGLTFVRKIIEKHKGKIWAESQEGVGTKFFFSLPETN
jgi:signal transduction histidine kinase